MPDPGPPTDATKMNSPAPALSLEATLAIQTPARLSLKKSWAYRHRLGVTAVVLVAAWSFVVFSPPTIAEGTPAAWVLNALGWMAFLAGSFLRIWATTWITGRKKTTVVDDGPYGLCRNPLYVGTFLMGLGLALILKSAVFVIAVMLLVAMYAKFVVP